MCDICGKNPCDARCPNCEEKVIYVCVECGQYIYEGEQYWDSQAGPICRDCFDDMDRMAILELCDEKLQEAKEEIEWMN